MMRDTIDPPDPDRDATAPESQAGEALSRLLHLAGPRRSAPARVVAEVKQATRPAWRAKVRAVARARRRRRMWTLAAAAVVLVSAGLVLRQIVPGLPAAPARVATVEVAAGTVATGGSRSSVLSTGTELDAGSTIETGPASHATLRLAGGASARLDAGTVLRLASATALELERGAVYLDTGSALGDTALEVTTRYGVARDVGTQFEVRLSEDALRIQVREGEVEVDLGPATYAAEAGRSLRVGADGVIVRKRVAAYGPEWGWILHTSPPFELEGRTLGEFLHWVTRETGWRTRFADPALEREVTGTVVHGSIAGTRADQAPDLVLPGFGLRYRLEGGTLVIEQAVAGGGA